MRKSSSSSFLVSRSLAIVAASLLIAMAYAPASQAQDDTAPLASGAAAKGQADAKLPITGSFALLSDYRFRGPESVTSPTKKWQFPIYNKHLAQICCSPCG